MDTGPCCRRICLDTRYLGQVGYDCAERGFHDWLCDGQTCCDHDPQRWRQTCSHCRAVRWVEPPLTQTPVDAERPVEHSPITAAEVDQAGRVAERIRVLAHRFG